MYDDAGTVIETLEKWLCWTHAACSNYVSLDPLPIFLNTPSRIKVPQDSFHRPNESFFHTVGLAFNNGDEVLGESHANRWKSMLQRK
ncbi:hypothetical protein M3J09_007462 [Ascochyta lentis]